MTQLVLGAAGAVIGGYFGGPTGAQVGFAIGSAIGASMQTIKNRGPKLDDLKAPQSSYGGVIPMVVGSIRTGGVWAWASEKREIATTVGGKGGPNVENTTYTYEIDALILLSSLPGGALLRVWAQGKLIYSVREGTDDDTLDASFASEYWDDIRFYDGSASQLPDPTYEAAVGTADALAYRGRTSVFIEGLKLGNSGQVPMLTFEVCSDGTPGGGELYSDDCTDYATLADGWTLNTGSFAQFDLSAISIGGTGLSFTASGGDATADVIERYFASASVTPFEPRRITFDYYLGTDDIDDAMTFRVMQQSGTVTLFAFNGRREGVYDGAQRPFWVSGPAQASRFIGSSKLAVFTWYHVEAIWDEVGATATITITVKATGAVVATDSVAWSPSAYTADMVQLATDGDPDVCSTTIANMRVSAGDTAIVTPVTLQDAVAQQCELAGLAASEYDVSALSGNVSGFAVTQIAAPRVTLEMLATAYSFIAYEGGGKVRFRPRASSPVDSIAYADLGATDAERIEALPLTRANDIEVPSQVTVRYANASNDYQDGAESSERLTTEQTSVEAMELALALTPQEAKRIAEIRASDLSNSGLRVEGLQLLKERPHIEPCDVMLVYDDDGSVYRLMVIKVTDAGVIRSIDAALDDASVSVGTANTDENYVDSATIARRIEGDLELLDIPILRDADDADGFYAAAGKASNSGYWPGGTLYRGQADANYVEAATFASSGYVGQTSGALGDWTGGTVFDEKNSVLVFGAGTLDSYTRDQIQAATARPVLIGGEVLFYRTATPYGSPVQAGAYVLSGLLRGRRGTEWAMSTHADGDRVVLLHENSLRRIELTTGQVGIEYDYKLVTNGNAIDTYLPEAFTCTNVGLRPFSPVDVRAVLQDDGSTLLSWKRRTRLACRFVGSSGISTPLGETSEAYEIDLYTPDSPPVLLGTQEADEEQAVLRPIQTVATFPDLAVGAAGYARAAGYWYTSTAVYNSAQPYQYIRRADSNGYAAGQSVSIGRGASNLLVVGGYVFVIGTEYTAGVPQYVLSTTLYKLNPAAMSTTAGTYAFPNAGDATWIATDGTYIYAPGYITGNIYKIDPATMTVADTVPVRDITAPNSFAYLYPIAYGDGAVFTATYGTTTSASPSGDVMRVDMAGSPNVRWKVNVAGAGSALFYADGTLWVQTSTGFVVLDATDGATLFTSTDGQTVIGQFSATEMLVTQAYPADATGEIRLMSDGSLVRTVAFGLSPVRGDNTEELALGNDTLGTAPEFRLRARAVAPLSGNFSGYTAVVYQVSDEYGRGKPATYLIP